MIALAGYSAYCSLGFLCMVDSNFIEALENEDKELVNEIKKELKEYYKNYFK